MLHEQGSLTGGRQAARKSARPYVDRLIPWLERHRDVPFFVFLHVFDPHSEFEPRPPYNTMWADPSQREAHLGRVAALSESIPRRWDSGRKLSRDELVLAGVDEHKLVAYYHDWYDGSIRGMDTEIGRILEQLDELGLGDRTLVAFIGDHGEEFFEHGSTWHGHTVYGELTNVPLILRQPGVIPVDREVSVTVRTIDLMPTILELSGLPVPAGAQGQTLTPLLTADEEDTVSSEWVIRPAVSEEHLRSTGRERDQHASFALVLGGWRLIHNTKTPEEDPGPEFELYNHEADPLALHDIADEHPDVVERLAAELTRWERRMEVARLPSDEELSSTLSSDELERLRSLGYLR